MRIKKNPATLFLYKMIMEHTRFFFWIHFNTLDKYLATFLKLFIILDPIFGHVIVYCLKKDSKNIIVVFIRVLLPFINPIHSIVYLSYQLIGKPPHLEDEKDLSIHSLPLFYLYTTEKKWARFILYH